MEGGSAFGKITVRQGKAGVGTPRCYQSPKFAKFREGFAKVILKVNILVMKQFLVSEIWSSVKLGFTYHNPQES